jgi:hypothetical protein
VRLVINSMIEDAWDPLVRAERSRNEIARGREVMPLELRDLWRTVASGNQLRPKETEFLERTAYRKHMAQIRTIQTPPLKRHQSLGLVSIRGERMVRNDTAKTVRKNLDFGALMIDDSASQGGVKHVVNFPCSAWHERVCVTRRIDVVEDAIEVRIQKAIENVSALASSFSRC